jgi:hypothetical protein
MAKLDLTNQSSTMTMRRARTWKACFGRTASLARAATC